MTLQPLVKCSITVSVTTFLGVWKTRGNPRVQKPELRMKLETLELQEGDAFHYMFPYTF